MGVTPLFERRLLILAGKGGTGRTTVAAALARAAVRAGKRVLLAQTNAPPRLAHLLGCPESIGPDIVAVGERLWAVNMNQRSAQREYILKVLRYESVYRALFENRAMRGFLGAMPGLEAWAMLGKTWWHTTEREDDGHLKYDLVILDGPGSGHILTMLRVPAAVQVAMPMGPLARPAQAARALLADPQQAALLIVTLAEELPARETVVLAREVRSSLGIPLGPLIVNAMPPEEAGRPELHEVLESVEPATTSAGLASTVDGAAVLAARRSDAERIVENLARDPGLPMLQLPRMPTNDLGPAQIEQLSRLLDRDALARAFS